MLLDTHSQVTGLIGGPISLSKLKDNAIGLWQRLRKRVGEGCSSGSAIPHEDTSYGHEGVYGVPSNIPPGMNGTSGYPCFNCAMKVVIK